MNKSYLKWAGGKSRILEDVLAIFPTGERFLEPFAGSCTVTLNANYPVKISNDINRDLMHCHHDCYDHPEELLEILSELYELGRESYYDLRDEFNENLTHSVRRSAIFIYMNKHGFNGMCRYNSSGVFNIPVGKSKTIHFPKEEILNFKKDIGNTKFLNTSFEEVLDEARSGDVVYCDPPYVPASVTKSDINYTGGGFPYELQVLLKDKAIEAVARGATVIISNHDLEVTRGLYEEADEIISIEAFRSISSGKRGNVSELIAIYKPTT